MDAFTCVQWAPGDSKGSALPGTLPNSYLGGGLKHWQIKALQVGVQQGWCQGLTSQSGFCRNKK